MNELKIFENPEFGQIRTVEVDGEPWLVGKDVAAALGYTNPQKALRDHVDSEDCTVNESFTVNGTQGTLINESGLYSLVLSSKLPGAKKFRRWVTSEVLPSVRRHGAYLTQEKVEEALLNPDTMIRLLEEIKMERQRRATLEAQAQTDRPKVIFADAVSASQTSILIGDLAKIIKQNGVEKMGQNRLFEWMRNNEYLIKSGNRRNMPTQKSMELGLFEVKETTIANPDGSTIVKRTTKVTGKGQQYFINRFLAMPKKEERVSEKYV